MLQGGTLRLHKNSICEIREGDVGSLCHIVAHDDQRKLWHVRGWDLVKFASDNKDALVTEPSLQLCFSLLPQSIGRLKFYQHIAHAPSQGACGRGLVAAQDIKAHAPIFEEPPFMVVCDPSSSGAALHWRWQAFKVLMTKASRDTADGMWSRALTVFQDLSSSDAPESVYEASRTIAAMDVEEDTEVDPTWLSEREQRVREALMRYSTNQHRWHSGGSASHHATGGATALYPFTSRANHSCAPSMLLSLKEDVHGLYGRPFDVEKDGGVVVFTALRDIRAGEPLTYSYAHAATMGVEQKTVSERREILKRASGFICQCERCVAEEGEAKSEAEGELASTEEPNLSASPINCSHSGRAHAPPTDELSHAGSS